MPEGPEVQTIVDALGHMLAGRKVQGVQQFADYAVINADISGAVFTEARRIGKNIVLSLDDGRFVVIHLKITGQLFLHGQACERPRFSKLRLLFDDGDCLDLCDRSKWVRFEVHDKAPDDILTQNMGVDVLSDKFTLDAFKAIKKHKKPIHSALLDQSILSGLGNIYVNEILWLADVHPKTKAPDLTENQVQGLYFAIKHTMRHALRHRGTTFSDYRTPDGEKGQFQNYLKAFMREDQPCLRCGHKLQRMKISGRSCVFCPDMLNHDSAKETATDRLYAMRCKTDVM